MKRVQKILAGTVGALTLAAMTAVVAAPYGEMGGMGMGGFQGMGGMGMMHGGMAGGGAGVMSGQNLDQLKTQLGITSQQEPAWLAFASKATEQAGLMQATHAQRHQEANAPTAVPDRMAQRIGSMTQHLEGMKAVNAALNDLYAVLTPEQRKIADTRFGHGPQQHRGFGRGMHG